MWEKPWPHFINQFLSILRICQALRRRVILHLFVVSIRQYVLTRLVLPLNNCWTQYIDIPLLLKQNVIVLSFITTSEIFSKGAIDLKLKCLLGYKILYPWGKTKRQGWDDLSSGYHLFCKGEYMGQSLDHNFCLECLFPCEIDGAQNWGREHNQVTTVSNICLLSIKCHLDLLFTFGNSKKVRIELVLWQRAHCTWRSMRPGARRSPPQLICLRV